MDLFKKKDKIPKSVFVNMDEHQTFLDKLYETRTLTTRSLNFLEKIPFKSKYIRKAIKVLWKEIRMIQNDIRVEEQWRGKD